MTTNLSATVNRPHLPEGGGGINAEIAIEPEGEDQPAERHIAVCIDSSGSMKYGKMDQVKDAVELVFGILNEDDYISLISFDDDVDAALEASRWGDLEREEAEESLDRIVPGGGTDIYSGLERAEEELSQLHGGDGISKRVLLLSDGRDLRAKPPDFEPLAKDIADAGISIYAAGIGTDYGTEVIKTVGEQSQGRWAHVEQATDVRSFFGDVVQEATTVLANNPRLVLDAADGCEVGAAFRRLPQVQKVDLEYEDGSVVVGLPDLQDRERQEVVLKLDAPGGDAGTSQTLVDVALEAGSESAETEISVSYTDDESKLAEHNEDVTVAYHDTDLRTRIAHADGEHDLEAVKEQIDETEVITGEKELADALRENVTRIEEGDESETRKVQEDATVVYDAEGFD